MQTTLLACNHSSGWSNLNRTTSLSTHINQFNVTHIHLHITAFLLTNTTINIQSVHDTDSNSVC